ncbi:PAS domain-containing sensor histidine kinase [Nocardioides ferulae]|uniref:PAS domain-containing sensor histidine kinase n=1 Tax=Nocardioides ferulae TaxID=2340821 RepID=UPI0013DDC4C9|nr:PAS domain-containing sensor histidine kinase [Nocardioides ferulae]
MGALLAGITLIAVAGGQTAPERGQGLGAWPMGLASSMLVLCGRRWALALLPLVLTVAVSTIDVYRPFEVALGYGLSITAETALVWWILTRGRDERPTLQENRDLHTLLGVAVGGAGLGAAGGMATSALTGFGSPALVGISMLTAHAASQLVLLPLVVLLAEHEPLAGRAEQVAQWAVVAVATPLAFWSAEVPSLVFAVIPLLTWGALRASPRVAMGQMVLMIMLGVTMTVTGRGPFAAAPEVFELPVEARGILLAVFAMTCALMVVPMVVSVGLQELTSRAVAGERDKVRRIVDGATGVAIVVTDERGLVTTFNPGAERLLGWRADEVLGGPTTHFHTERQLEEKARELGIPWRGQPSVVELVHRLTEADAGDTLLGFLRKDGAERMHTVTVRKLHDDHGAVVGYLSTSEDVTEQMATQRALEEALAVERNAVERLREVDAVKDAFVSSVSHELRTPLTSIHGYLEMLEDGAFGELTAAQSQAVRKVAANGTRLMSLIDDLLTLSRLQENGLGIAADRLDLAEAVRTGWAVVAPAWADRDLSLRLRLPLAPVPFDGDRDMLERVVVNLLGNAVKFTPDGGSVSVELDVEPETATLTVRDTGIGIPAEEQSQLFTRFFRSSLAQKGAIPGSGLGLSIAAAIVEQHGGSVDVRSAEAAGTTFMVRLPLRGVATADPTARSGDAAADPATAGSSAEEATPERDWALG